MSLEAGPVQIKVDLREPRHELAASFRNWRRARSLVVSDPDILGGDPVFRGTRVPVYLIAKLATEGSAEADILEAYPRLTAEMIHLAPVYAQAYPIRGRPRKQPWQSRLPLRTVRIPHARPGSKGLSPVLNIQEPSTDDSALCPITPRMKVGHRT
jgi:uncharacterized protein (DUF433 family)